MQRKLSQPEAQVDKVKLLKQISKILRASQSGQLNLAVVAKEYIGIINQIVVETEMRGLSSFLDHYLVMGITEEFRNQCESNRASSAVRKAYNQFDESLKIFILRQVTETLKENERKGKLDWNVLNDPFIMEISQHFQRQCELSTASQQVRDVYDEFKNNCDKIVRHKNYIDNLIRVNELAVRNYNNRVIDKGILEEMHKILGQSDSIEKFVIEICAEEIEKMKRVYVASKELSRQLSVVREWINPEIETLKSEMKKINYVYDYNDDDQLSFIRDLITSDKLKEKFRIDTNAREAAVIYYIDEFYKMLLGKLFANGAIDDKERNFDNLDPELFTSMVFNPDFNDYPRLDAHLRSVLDVVNIKENDIEKRTRIIRKLDDIFTLFIEATLHKAKKLIEANNIDFKLFDYIYLSDYSSEYFSRHPLYSNQLDQVYRAALCAYVEQCVKFTRETFGTMSTGELKRGLTVADDSVMYQLCLLEEESVSHNTTRTSKSVDKKNQVIEENYLYIKKSVDDGLIYKVKNLEGDVITGYIPHAALPKEVQTYLLECGNNIILKDMQPYVKQILEITALKGDTNSDNKYQAFIDHFNNLNFIVKSDILGCTQPISRMLAFERWVAIMVKFVELDDLHSFMAVKTALMSDEVVRLNITANKAFSQSAARMLYICNQFAPPANPADANANIRYAINEEIQGQTGRVIVPYLAAFKNRAICEENELTNAKPTVRVTLDGLKAALKDNKEVELYPTENRKIESMHPIFLLEALQNNYQDYKKTQIIEIIQNTGLSIKGGPTDKQKEIRHKAFVDSFKDIIIVVKRDILDCTSLTSRRAIFERWVNVMERFAEQGDLRSFLAVKTALTSDEVAKLNITEDEAFSKSAARLLHRFNQVVPQNIQAYAYSIIENRSEICKPPQVNPTGFIQTLKTALHQNAENRPLDSYEPEMLLNDLREDYQNYRITKVHEIIKNKRQELNQSIQEAQEARFIAMSRTLRVESDEVPQDNGYNITGVNVIPQDNGYNSTGVNVIPQDNGYNSTGVNVIPQDNGYNSTGVNAIPQDSGYSNPETNENLQTVDDNNKANAADDKTDCESVSVKVVHTINEIDQNAKNKFEQQTQNAFPQSKAQSEYKKLLQFYDLVTDTFEHKQINIFDEFERHISLLKYNEDPIMHKRGEEFSDADSETYGASLGDKPTQISNTSDEQSQYLPLAAAAEGQHNQSTSSMTSIPTDWSDTNYTPRNSEKGNREPSLPFRLPKITHRTPNSSPRPGYPGNLSKRDPNNRSLSTMSTTSDGPITPKPHEANESPRVEQGNRITPSNSTPIVINTTSNATVKIKVSNKDNVTPVEISPALRTKLTDDLSKQLCYENTNRILHRLDELIKPKRSNKVEETSEQDPTDLSLAPLKLSKKGRKLLSPRIIHHDIDLKHSNVIAPAKTKILPKVVVATSPSIQPKQKSKVRQFATKFSIFNRFSKKNNKKTTVQPIDEDGINKSKQVLTKKTTGGAEQQDLLMHAAVRGQPFTHITIVKPTEDEGDELPQIRVETNLSTETVPITLSTPNLNYSGHEQNTPIPEEAPSPIFVRKSMSLNDTEIDPLSHPMSSKQKNSPVSFLKNALSRKKSVSLNPKAGKSKKSEKDSQSSTERSSYRSFEG